MCFPLFYLSSPKTVIQYTHIWHKGALPTLKKSTFYAHIEGVAQQKNITVAEAFKKVYDLGFTGIDCDYESIKNQGIEKFKEY